MHRPTGTPDRQARPYLADWHCGPTEAKARETRSAPTAWRSSGRERSDWPSVTPVDLLLLLRPTKERAKGTGLGTSCGA